MGTPIYVLAGQSNARAMRDAIVQTLEAQHGADGFVLVDVSASGAPLTFKRSAEDWAASNELRAQLTNDTVAALSATPDGRMAGIIWLQGEADTHDVARPEEYQTRLDALMNDFRREVADTFATRDTGIFDARLAVSALSDHAGAATRDNWSKIIAAQAAYADQNALSVLIDPDAVAQALGIPVATMFEDSLHYAQPFRVPLAEALISSLHTVGAGAGYGGVLGSDNDDVLGGTRGADNLIGGQGDDIYLFNHRGDRIIEAAGEGTDLVFAYDDCSLRKHGQALENLTLAGEGDLNGTGNRRDNVIAGNDGDNTLKGALGNDVLLGGDGNDTFADWRGANQFFGGAGNDTYIIDHKRNRLIEEEGEGVDTVIASVSFTLRFHSQHIENLTLTGTGHINGTGNGLDNVLTGNAGDNHLDGAWGDDRIDGGAGNDTLIGHLGDDVLTGGAGQDVFRFAPGTGHDRITDFDLAEDRLAFGGGLTSADLAITQVGADTRVEAGDTQSVLLEGVTAAELAEAHFLWL